VRAERRDVVVSANKPALRLDDAHAQLAGLFVAQPGREMRGKLAEADEDFVAGLPVDARGYRRQARARSCRHGDFVGPDADQGPNLFANTVRQIEIEAIGDAVRVFFPFERLDRPAHGRQRHRSLQGGVEIGNAFEFGEGAAVVWGYRRGLSCHVEILSAGGHSEQLAASGHAGQFGLPTRCEARPDTEQNSPRQRARQARIQSTVPSGSKLR